MPVRIKKSRMPLKKIIEQAVDYLKDPAGLVFFYDIVNVFLKELSEAYSDKNILLIWDQAGYHRSKDLQIPSNIVIEPLPPYSPELNPAERLWR